MWRSRVEINSILSSVLSVAAMLASFAYFVSVIKNGKNKADGDAIDTFQAELKILHEKITRIENENLIKDKEIARLTGKVEELARENTELRNTLALRDPEFSNTMKSLCDNIPKLVTSIDTIDKNASIRYEEIMAECREIKMLHDNKK